MFLDILNNVDLFTFLIFVVVFLLTYVIWDNLNYKNVKRINIPGPKPWPLVGNLPTFIGTTNISQIALKLQKIYGDLVLLRIGKKPIVFVFGYKNVREILVDNANYTKCRSTTSYVTKKLFPNNVAGVILSNGQEWSDIRKFSMIALKDFGVGKKSIEVRIHEEVEYLVDLFSKQTDKPTDVDQIFAKATSNIISNIIFGTRFDYEDPDFNRLLANIKFLNQRQGAFMLENVFPILDKINPNSKVAKLVHCRHDIQNYIRKRIDEQRDSYDPNVIRNFLDLCLIQEDNKYSKISEDSLFLTLADLYTAGTDTTSVTLQWAMLYMLKYPNVQTKCRNEILETVGERRLAVKDKDKLPYVMATLHEIQRISTIGPLALPHKATDDICIDNKLIPKDTVILCSLLSVHLDPNQWMEPELFRPERFLGKDGQFVKHEAFSPFSMGPRICLGKQLAETELFLFFTSFLQRLSLVKFNENDDLSTVGVHTGITMQPQPFKMKFIPKIK